MCDLTNYIGIRNKKTGKVIPFESPKLFPSLWDKEEITGIYINDGFYYYTSTGYCPFYYENRVEHWPDEDNEFQWLTDKDIELLANDEYSIGPENLIGD